MARWDGLELDHFPFANATRQGLYVNLVGDSIPAKVGFLRVIWFPPTPHLKTRNPHISVNRRSKYFHPLQVSESVFSRVDADVQLELAIIAPHN